MADAEWGAARGELDRLEAAHAGGEDVCLAAASMVDRLQRTHGTTVTDPEAARALAHKARQVRARLRVGTLPMPDGADPVLHEIVFGFSERILGRGTLEAFELALDNYCRVAREAQSRRIAMTQLLACQTGLRDALEAYLELLDALQPPVRSAEGGT